MRIALRRPTINPRQRRSLEAGPPLRRARGQRVRRDRPGAGDCGERGRSSAARGDRLRDRERGGDRARLRGSHPERGQPRDRRAAGPGRRGRAGPAGLLRRHAADQRMDEGWPRHLFHRCQPQGAAARNQPRAGRSLRRRDRRGIRQPGQRGPGGIAAAVALPGALRSDSRHDRRESDRRLRGVPRCPADRGARGRHAARRLPHRAHRRRRAPDGPLDGVRWRVSALVDAEPAPDPAQLAPRRHCDRPAAARGAIPLARAELVGRGRGHRLRDADHVRERRGQTRARPRTGASAWGAASPT